MLGTNWFVVDNIANIDFSSVFRSKSRSVDHGITSPFDLDSLRSKVDSQFDRSIDKGEFDSKNLKQ